MASINYAELFGLQSVAGASIFAVLYVPLLGCYVFLSARKPTYVFIVLSLFCAIRCTSFIIRAVLAGSDSAGENLGLFTAEQVLFGVGFFALLYSAYTLVLDRELLAQHPPRTHPIMKLIANRHLFRLAMTVAVALGIVAATRATSSDSSQVQSSQDFRTASAVIFLVLTVLQTFQTLNLIRNGLGGRTHVSDSFGDRHGHFILCAISLLLLVREAFAVATVRNTRQANNEHLWYPLQALPELLAVYLYMIPGLVPPRRLLKEAEQKQKAMNGTTKEYHGLASRQNIV